MMQEPALYILCGLPFAGKTTLALEMERTMGVVRVAIDQINDERGVWDDETGMPPEEWDKTYAEAYRRIDALLARGKAVADDSVNFTRDLRDKLRAIAARHGAPAVVVYIDVPVSEARRRWHENRSASTRADVRDDDFALVVEHFEPPADDERMVRYNGSIPPVEWIEQTFGVPTGTDGIAGH